MNLSEALQTVTGDLARSMPGLAPEIALVLVIVLFLLVRLLPGTARFNVNGIALLGTIVALILAAGQLTNMVHPNPSGVLSLVTRLVQTAPASPSVAHDTPIELFTGMLRFDNFTIFFRLFLLGFVAFVIWLTTLTGIPDDEDSPDFYTLLLGSTVGMLLMVAANHLLMVFIAVEMASLPSYAMAGFLKGRRQGSEAALKYVVFGAGASGIMLYGISLLAGRYGTAHLPTLANAIVASGPAVEGVLLLGLMLVLVGVAFKISAVPFHFWCPDVFEGAAAEVAGFLSVASKAAALGLLVRLASTLTLSVDTSNLPHAPPPIDLYVGAAIAFLAAITTTYGNLAAYAQTNLKRLLAYSTIAHAGYMMMPVAAAVAAKRMRIQPQDSLESLLFYLLIYLFMNLGAFAVVALIRNEVRSEDLKDYGGLSRRSPFLTFAMAVFLLSLTGIPPLAGFAAKFRIGFALFETQLYWLLVILFVNTVFSAFYYLKVVRVMVFDAPPASAPGWTVPFRTALYCSLLVAVNLGVIVVGKAWEAMDVMTQLAIPDLLVPI
jgi:NADH-quinone oxidoreductase subunit N